MSRLATVILTLSCLSTSFAGITQSKSAPEEETKINNSLYVRDSFPLEGPYFSFEKANLGFHMYTADKCSAAYKAYSPEVYRAFLTGCIKGVLSACYRKFEDPTTIQNPIIITKHYQLDESFLKQIAHDGQHLLFVPTRWVSEIDAKMLAAVTGYLKIKDLSTVVLEYVPNIANDEIAILVTKKHGQKPSFLCVGPKLKVGEQQVLFEVLSKITPIDCNLLKAVLKTKFP